MMRVPFRSMCFFAAAVGVVAAPPALAAERLAAALMRAAPGANATAIDLATRALSCARASDGVEDRNTLTVIDYSRPSTDRRLWVFDLAHRVLLFEEWVAHGRNTGEDKASRFSNEIGSAMTSLGAFVTEDAYVGHNGYSLHLRGLEQGINDHARDRAIVIHGASYVNPERARSSSRLGRSLGCPAVRTAVAPRLIDTIRGGSFVFAYYPDAHWLRHSRFLGDCDASATNADVRDATALATRP